MSAQLAELSRYSRRWAFGDARNLKGRSQLLHVLQDVGGVAGNAHLVPDPANDPGSVYHEGHALDAEERATVQGLLFHRAVSQQNLLVKVGQQWERQPELCSEPFVSVGTVAADPQDDRSGFVKLFDCVSKLSRLSRSPGCIVLRVEVENHMLLVPEIRQGYRRSSGRRQGELRRLVSFTQHLQCLHFL